ncbi:DinB family protein [Paenibacillus lutrae]|uniref:DinB-like domain-containing protein n=1 Tax=Paenibacillus lutrae TaxID=2078573 RepID=A0A7X3FEN9_9BACL|nr:DinB family protein [Paenibacillus lutrae]MVO98316.1 hypothetical protein [Paenibacillus lutrae]
MQESAIFDLYHIYREETIESINFITEEQADVIPAGFSNSLRWNFGHILVAQEQAMYNLGMNQPGEIFEKTQDMFKRGSSPKEWSVTPFSLKELRDQLQEQMERMKITFSGRLGEAAAKEFDMGKERKIKTLGDLFIGSLWHEGVHQGIIYCMKRSLK